jgi:predicted HD phosphohydrolase
VGGVRATKTVVGEMTKCWFCLEPLMRKVNGRVWECDNHHVIARRYFGHGEDHEFKNLVPAHRHCHSKWHRQYDVIGAPLEEYVEYMDKLQFGKGIFAHVSVAAD